MNDTDRLVEPREATITYETDEPVRYEVQGPVAHIIMNRPRYHNAQNSQMTYALDAAFRRAVDDDAVRAIVLRGEGKHFSAGHDIGTPGRDITRSFQRQALCRRWRDVPKPTIAAVQGACIAGGLMLAWVCDIIVATDDAFFQDPVNRMGSPGVEYFAHGFELPPRIAKEFILLGERMSAERAYNFGMVNRLSTRETLLDDVQKIGEELASRPRLSNWLTKQALNHVEDLRGKRTATDAHFHMHHFAHAQSDLTSSNSLGGMDSRSMAAANKKQAGEG
jgi:enoyl-CoA hydratase